LGGGSKAAQSRVVCWQLVWTPEVVQQLPAPEPEQIAPVALHVAAWQAPLRQICPLPQ
jgi:hypothetical protein